MELLTNLKLIPTYSYHRLYKHNDILKKHKDRKSCEISTTVCLGYDISNLENKNYNWPMFVLQNGKEIPLYLNAGDMINLKVLITDKYFYIIIQKQKIMIIYMIIGLN